MVELKKNFEYPDIKQTDFIDESLEKIKTRDDAAKNSFSMQGSFPSPVTEEDIGRKVYRADLQAEYRLVTIEPDPKWIPVTDETGTPVTRETINSNFQPLNATLTSLSGLGGSTNQLPFFASKNNLQLTALSEFAKELLAKLNAEELRALLGLGDVALLNTPIDGNYIKDGTIPYEKFDHDTTAVMSFQTGDVLPTFAKQAPAGWIMADDGTIGSATSGATHASDDTKALYELLWGYSFTQIYTVTGSPSTKSSRFDLDWNANKRLQVSKMVGRVLGCAGQGAGLTPRYVGDTLGEETHKLIIDEMPKHTHSIGARQGGTYQYAGSTGWYNGSTKITGESGGDKAHNNMQPTFFINYKIKL